MSRKTLEDSLRELELALEQAKTRSSKPSSPWWLSSVNWLASFAIIVCTCMPLAGWVVATLWGWFLVPLGLPAITWLHGAGIDLLVTFVASGGPPPLHPGLSEKEKLTHFVTGLYVRPLAVLGLGWIVHSFMGAM